MVGRDRPPVYADEDVDRPLIEALRERSFQVLTAGEAGLLGADDEQQLEHAAALGRVLISLNRLHFRRLHARWRAEGRHHHGIVVLPQQGPVARRAVRAAMLLDELVTAGEAARFLGWGELQVRLHRGERPAGYSEADVRLALGLISGPGGGSRTGRE